MNLRFTKMHGLGNDFMVIDGIRQTLPETGLPCLRMKYAALATAFWRGFRPDADRATRPFR